MNTGLEAALTDMTDMLRPEVNLVIERVRRHRLSQRWSTKSRIISDHLLYCIMQGSMSINLDHEVVTLSAGQTMWMSPGTRHHAQNLGDSPISCFICRWQFQGEQGHDILNERDHHVHLRRLEI